MHSKRYLQCLVILVLIVIVFNSSQEEIADKFCSIHSSEKKCATKSLESFSESTVITSYPGHWPENYCKLTNVYLKSAEKSFFVGLKNLSSIDSCYGTRNIWPFKSKPNFLSTISQKNYSATKLNCDQVFQIGYVFTLYYYHGSNYFHLHYDAALPIYYALHYQKNSKGNSNKNTIIMPSVEIERGMGTNWDTDAFMNESTYWSSLLEVLAKPYKLLPLDKKLVAMEKTLCFKEIYFGTPKIDLSMPYLIQDFSSFVKSSLHIPPIRTPGYEKIQLCLIHRIQRRKIINEEQLLNAIRTFAEAELVDFAELSYSKQIETVQKYDILVGMNGAGLMNAIYLPSSSVTIQLIPFKAQVNYKEYKQLLMARGPYLDWHNLHPNLSRSTSGDQFNNSADTYVNVDEFVSLIKKAIRLLKQ